MPGDSDLQKMSSLVIQKSFAPGTYNIKYLISKYLIKLIKLAFGKLGRPPVAITMCSASTIVSFPFLFTVLTVFESIKEPLAFR